MSRYIQVFFSATTGVSKNSDWCQAESQKLQSALDQMESKLKNLGAECWRFGREVGRDTPTMEVCCSAIRKWLCIIGCMLTYH